MVGPQAYEFSVFLVQCDEPCSVAFGILRTESPKTNHVSISDPAAIPIVYSTNPTWKKGPSYYGAVPISKKFSREFVVKARPTDLRTAVCCFSLMAMMLGTARFYRLQHKSDMEEGPFLLWGGSHKQEAGCAQHHRHQ
jgi:hypothetical protein